MRGKLASPDGPAFHVVLELWSQVWRFPNQSDRRIRAGMKRGSEKKSRARTNDKDRASRVVVAIEGLTCDYE